MPEAQLKRGKPRHEEICKALLDSGDLQIVKHITTYPLGDGFWDDGEDGKGLNHMGRMWMEIREELTSPSINDIKPGRIRN